MQLILLTFLPALIFLFVLIRALRVASLKRNWAPDQQQLPLIEFHDDKRLTIKNIRNIDYRSTTDYDVAYYDRDFDLDELDTAWFVVEPFDKIGAAHTLVSFGFSDGRYLAISPEIRKEEHENFSPFRGILGEYELMYVIADERDVIRLRTNYRHDTVRLYPVRAEPDVIRAVFLDMLARANKLAKVPEFYDTIANNCITNIVRHARKFSDKKLPWWNYRYLLPATVDKVAYKLGILDTDLPLAEAREYYKINDKAMAADKDPDFSNAIRKNLKF